MPTWGQAHTLRFLIEGWELIISEWCDESYRIMCEGKRKLPSRERIYWRKSRPIKGYEDFPNYDTMETSWPKLKRHQMSLLEKYGWVLKSDTGWTITEAGRAIHKKYVEYSAEQQKKFQAIYGNSGR